MDKLKVGDILIAEDYCGFPDNTTRGSEYTVIKVENSPFQGIMFWILDDEGKERFPISTTFKRKNTTSKEDYDGV